jgi:hypothetical protein
MNFHMALGKCYSEAASRALLPTLQHASYQISYQYLKLAGGTGAGVGVGSAAYQARSVDAMVSIAKMFDSEFYNPTHGPNPVNGKPQLVFNKNAKIWYQEAIKRGWLPAAQKCKYEFSETSTNPVSRVWAGPIASDHATVGCHSTWSTCDSVGQALMHNELKAETAAFSKLTQGLAAIGQTRHS